MSDERLRELERRWRETGSVEDEAAWLLERVRAGELQHRGVKLAAYCDHQAARLCLGPEAPVVRTNPRKFAARLSGPLSHDASLRAAIGLGELARSRLALVEEPLSLAIEMTAKALLREDSIKAAHDAWREANGTLTAPLEGWDLWVQPHPQPITYRDVLSEALNHLDGLDCGALCLVAMRDDLVPWALGYRDPVRERVEARQRANAEPHS